MSKIQKVLLVLSGIFYILVIIGFLLPTPWISLIFFILHSCTLLLFTYLIYEKHSSAGNDTHKLKSKISFLKHEIQILSDKNKELTDKNNHLKQELNKKQEELTAMTPLKENEASKTSSENFADPFLPPLLEDENPYETINLIEIVKETINELQMFADSVGLIIRISAVEDPLYLKASASRIRILFRNIIDNSIKYMKRSGTLIITLSIVGDDIFIVLKDNGKGLSGTETPHIFELNYQGSNRISGNGLGLTQAKAIVESYGGTIYAKSTPDTGMGIYIQIPLTYQS